MTAAGRTEESCLQKRRYTRAASSALVGRPRFTGPWAHNASTGIGTLQSKQRVILPKLHNVVNTMQRFRSNVIVSSLFEGGDRCLTHIQKGCNTCLAHVALLPKVSKLFAKSVDVHVD